MPIHVLRSEEATPPAFMRRQSIRWKKAAVISPYYYIGLICTAQEAKGQGVFRQFLEITLERAQAENLLVLLDTHNPANLHKHFGYALHQFQSAAGVSQYCLRRLPTH